MKKIYLIISVWLLPFILFAQEIEFTYHIPNPLRKQIPQGVVETPDAYIITYRDASINQQPFNKALNKLLKLNKQGEKLKETPILPQGIDTTRYYRMNITDVFLLSTDTICVIGSVMSDFNNEDDYDDIYIAYYDTELKKIKEVRIGKGDSYQITIGDIYFNSEGNLIYYGGVNNTSSYDNHQGAGGGEILNSFICEIDLNTHTLLRFVYTSDLYVLPLHVTNLIEYPDYSGYLVSNLGTRGPQILKLDKNLNTVETFLCFRMDYEYTEFLFFKNQSLIQTGSDLRYINDGHEDFNSELSELFCIQKYSSNYEMISERLLGDYTCGVNFRNFNAPSREKSTGISKANDSLFYYAGTANMKFIGYEPSYILVNKLDLDLNVKWQQTIGEKGDAAYRSYILYPTRDGGVLLLNTYSLNSLHSEFNKYGNCSLHIVKLSGGNEHTGDDGIAENNTTTTPSICTLFPNPSQGVLHIDVPKGYEEKYEHISLYTLSGQLMYHDNIMDNNMIDLSHLKEGMYIYKLSGRDNTIWQSGKWIKQ